MMLLLYAFFALVAFYFVQCEECPGWFTDDCQGYEADKCLQELNVGDCLNVQSSRTREKAFSEHCKDKICFILQIEPGLINVGNNNGDVPTEPVLCNDITNNYPHISGPVLDIFRETFSDDEMCLFVADKTCGSYELMQYVESSPYDNYQFAIGPIAEATLEKCKHRESGAWLDDKIVVVGSFDENSNIEKSLLVIEPFQVRALLFLAGMLVICMIFAVLLLVRIVGQGKEGFLSFLFILTGAYDDSEKVTKHNQSQRSSSENEEDRSKGFPDTLHVQTEERNDNENKDKGKIIPMKYAFLTSLLRFAFFSVLVIFFLFLEAGAVNDLADRQAQTGKRLEQKFDDIDKSRYCVQHKSVLSEAVEKRVSDNGSSFVHRSSIMECFDELLDPESDVQFVLTHKLAADSILADQDLCDKYTVLEINSDIYNFNSRWIFNSKVNHNYTSHFDRNLVSLRINGTIENLLRAYAPECVPRSQVVKFRTGHTSLVVGIFVGLPFVVAVIFLAFFLLKFKNHYVLECSPFRLCAGGRTPKDKHSPSPHAMA